MADLFDFFKENESKLHEAPPARAWSQLEARLERKKRRKRRGIRFLQLGVVVALVLLLLMVGYVVWNAARR